MYKALWRSNRPLFGTTNTSSNTSTCTREIMIDGLAVQWRKSAKRKRSLALKIDADGLFLAMTPQATSERTVRAFIIKRRAWMQAQLKQHLAMQAAQLQAKGRHVLFEGAELPLEMRVARPNKTSLAAGRLRITRRQALSAEKLDAAANKWLREQAEKTLPLQLLRVAQAVKLQPTACVIKTYKARWGSCRHDGEIQLNWKLIKVPPAVRDYVLIHELCHLQYFDHSREFWGLVARHCPEYKHHRSWLKANGQWLLG